jgi:cytochrome c peroxidase
VAKTAPYIHDGSVNELEKAIEIMAKVQLNKDLKPSETQTIALFLNTLTGTVPLEALQANR